MRPTLLAFVHLGVLVTGLAGCGGGGDNTSSARQLCNQSAAATCEKNFACGGASALADLGYTSVEDCTKQSQAFCVNPTCPTGTTYHAEQVQKCIDETKAQSCAAFADNPPISCTEVCIAAGTTPATGGSTAGAGGASGAGGSTTSGTGGTAGKEGTSASPLAACTATFKACGGDPTGTWDIVSACIEGDLVSAFNAALAKDYPSCAGAFSAYNMTILSGSVTYSSGNYAYDSRMEADSTVVYTPACVSALQGTTLTASVCSGVEQNFNSRPGTTATCTYATNCTCHSLASHADTTSGTYTISGSSITEDSGSNYDFCVSGNTMSQRQQIEGNAYGITQLKRR